MLFPVLLSKHEVRGARACWELAHSAMQVDIKGVCPSPVDLLIAQPVDSRV